MAGYPQARELPRCPVAYKIRYDNPEILAVALIAFEVPVRISKKLVSRAVYALIVRDNAEGDESSADGFQKPPKLRPVAGFHPTVHRSVRIQTASRGEV